MVLDLATYFGVRPEILCYLPELLKDFGELGSDPERVVEWLGQEGIGHGSRVLDLGSGKGAVSLALTEDLGCSVDGVDGLPEFVEFATAQARERGLDGLCRFEVADLRDTVQSARGYDAVLLVSVGVLGSAEAMVRGCRACVHEGGLILIEDAYHLQSGTIDFTGYEELRSRNETLRQLEACGDHIVRERRTPVAEIREQNERYNRWIQQRAAELTRQHPEHAAAFADYVEKERQECEILETIVESATWLLRRANSEPAGCGHD